MDEKVEGAILEFTSETEDNALNGDFERLGYRYRNSLKNMKSTFSKMMIMVLSILMLLVLKELHLNSKG